MITAGGIAAPLIATTGVSPESDGGRSRIPSAIFLSRQRPASGYSKQCHLTIGETIKLVDAETIISVCGLTVAVCCWVCGGLSEAACKPDKAAMCARLP